MGADMMVAACHDFSAYTIEAVHRAIDGLDVGHLDELWDLYEYSIWDQETEEPDIAWIHEATRTWLKAAANTLFNGSRRDLDRYDGKVMVGGMSWGDSPDWFDEIGAFAVIGDALQAALGQPPVMTARQIVEALVNLDQEEALCAAGILTECPKCEWHLNTWNGETACAKCGTRPS